MKANIDIGLPKNNSQTRLNEILVSNFQVAKSFPCDELGSWGFFRNTDSPFDNPV